MKHGKTFEELMAVMKKLRGPKGCPWDKAQTHESIQTFLLNEAYETLEAIQDKKWSGLREELGDLLFQIVFHCAMAEDVGLFTIQDVIQGLTQKLKSRHPHVFGKAHVKDAEEQTLHWDEIKSAEKKLSLLDRVPKAMPALLQAFELQERAHRLGFKWNHISEVQEKLAEELEELEEAKKTGKQEELREELGDVLFMVAHLARWLKINPEEALLGTNKKFRQRFSYLESRAEKAKRKISDFPPEELERMWQEAKRNQKPA